MDLILWRHAEAEDLQAGQDDLQRPLTGRGERQAARVGEWLDDRLPPATRILCSPALRCEQTAQALGRKYAIDAGLRPGAPVAELLAAAGWPGAKQPVLLVGHQPVLGEAIAQLLRMADGGCTVRKGAVWWLRRRERAGVVETLVWAVQSADTV